MKEFIKGVFATLTFLVIIGGTLAAIAPEGSVINVPTGKFAIYHFIKNEDAPRLRDAVQYWEHNDSITTTEAAGIMSDNVKEYMRQYVLSAEADIAAEAARQAVLNTTVDIG